MISIHQIILEHAEGYGDLTDPAHLSDDPRVPFTLKFEEGLEECKEVTGNFTDR